MFILCILFLYRYKEEDGEYLQKEGLWHREGLVAVNGQSGKVF